MDMYSKLKELLERVASIEARVEKLEQDLAFLITGGDVVEGEDIAEVEAEADPHQLDLPTGRGDGIFLLDDEYRL